MDSLDAAPAAPRSRTVQLGSFPLVDCPYYTTIAFPHCWCVLDLDFLDHGDWSPDDKETQARVRTLRWLLREPTIAIDAQYLRAEGGFFVRVSILPADAQGFLASDAVLSRSAVKGHMKKLLGWITTDWEGEGNGVPVMGRNLDDAALSMRGIYTELSDPPEPDFAECSIARAKDAELFERLEGYERLEGVKTVLRSYQVRSVAKMIRHEMYPETLIDLCCVPVQEAGRDGIYYVNYLTFEIVTKPSICTMPRGGILCEQMGVGKTLICLALVVATLHQPCEAPPVGEQTSLAVTYHEIRTYTYPPYRTLRERLESSYKRPEQYRPRKPSLAVLCANIIAKDDPSAARDAMLTSNEKLRGRLNQVPFYYEFPIARQETRLRYTRLDKITREPRKIFLSSATLVIVPAILLPQWQQEIDKHLEKDALRVRIIKAEDKMPPLLELLASDLVLLDIDKLGIEARKGSQSVLKQARWKRLLLDEGSLASQQSNVVLFARDLDVDRKWLITGTPTRNLHQGAEGEAADIAMALPLDKQTSRDTKPTTEGDDDDTKIERSRIEDDTPLFADFNVGDEKPQKPDLKLGLDLMDEDTLQGEQRTTWSKRDREDSNRFGKMLCDFLGADLFSLEGVRFGSVITGQLCAKGGPMYGSVARMRELMEKIMVKHRLATIEGEIDIPPLKTTTQYLDLDPLQRTTYNALAALIAGNIYTVPAKSRGHFLHAKNKDAFQNVIYNLHLACFWYTSPDMKLQQSLEASETHLNTMYMTEENRTLLEEAVQQLRSAIQDPVWLEWNATHHLSVPFHAAALPEGIKAAASSSPNFDPSLVNVGMLIKLRNHNKGGVSHDDLETFAAIELAAASLSAEPVTGKGKVGKAKKTDDGVSSAPTLAGSVTTSPGSRKQSSRRTVTEMDAQLQIARQNAAVISERLDQSDMPRPLPDRIETFSRSAKVNYVLHSILHAPSEDKFVLFGSTSEIGLLAEVLDLANVKWCYVGAGIKKKIERRESLRKFEDPDVKVCMLELNFGARGLTMTLANRMIFLSPVWNLDVQAQAIKRIHRIGQTRPTRVEILVTRGTFEEDIARRGNVPCTDEDEKLYSRAMIEKPRFVFTSHKPTARFNVQFTPVTPDAADEVEIVEVERTSKKRARAKADQETSATTSSVAGPSRSKKTRIRFA